MDRLVLYDGTEIPNGFASKSSRDELMIRIPGNDINQAVIMFCNPEKTEEITSYYSIYKVIYKGYTNMYSVQYFDIEDYVEVWLKPNDGVVTSSEQEITVPEIYVKDETTSQE